MHPPWARELTRALLPGSEFFAAAAAAATWFVSGICSAAAAETLRSEDLDSSSVYSNVCRTRIIGLDTSGLGFRAVAFGGDLAQAVVGDSVGVVR